jgi:hypothetical protein
MSFVGLSVHFPPLSVTPAARLIPGERQTLHLLHQFRALSETCGNHGARPTIRGV